MALIIPSRTRPHHSSLWTGRSAAGRVGTPQVAAFTPWARTPCPPVLGRPLAEAGAQPAHRLARTALHTARNRLATGHSFDLYTMSAEGSNEQLLFPNASAGYVCGDSETGVVVFNSSSDPLGTNPERDFEIFTIGVTDVNNGAGILRQLTVNSVLDSGPKWSPDCSTISYNSLDAGSSLDIHRIDADGTGDVNLTNTPGVFDAFSAWSPEGRPDRVLKQP